MGLGSALLLASLVICGFIAGSSSLNHKTGFDSTIPVLAAASSESDGVIVATGAYTSSVEAVYYLDSQSCRLSAGLVSRSAPVLQKTFTRNLKSDLAEAAAQLQISIPTSPKFLMTTGEADVRNVGAVANMARALLYVAEINSGILFVYALPGANDRDLVVSNGEILLWTFARLNDGLQSSSAAASQPAESNLNTNPQLIDSGFYRTH